jgi:hypothetical protein
MAELAVLRTAKQAMDEDLISQQDFDVVKIAFLKAQQIKAGLDAGFIRQSDYDKARDAYLHALDFSIMTTFPNTVQGQPYPLQPQNSQQHSHPKQQATMGRTNSGHQLPQGTLAEVASDTAAAADRILGSNPRANGNVPYTSAAPSATPIVEVAPPRAVQSAFEPPVRAPSPAAPAAAATGAVNAMQSFGRSPVSSATSTPRAAPSGRDSGTGVLLDIPADLPQYAKGATHGKVRIEGAVQFVAAGPEFDFSTSTCASVRRKSMQSLVPEVCTRGGCMSLKSKFILVCSACRCKVRWDIPWP